MRTESCSLEEIEEGYGKLFVDYLKDHPSLRPFYELRPLLKSFEEQIQRRQSFSTTRRRLLQQTLQKQYASYTLSPKLSQHLNSLSQTNTFVVTSGHQLNICMGPLYVLFKIVRLIKLAQVLSEYYTDIVCVPLFWMHTEDHDVEEVRTLSFDGKRYEAPLHTTGGPVGQLPTVGVDKFLDTLPFCPSVFIKAYRNADSMTEASRYILHKYFGKTGLLVLDPQDPLLKISFSEVMKKDLLEETTFTSHSIQNQSLKALGYNIQLKAQATNLFYLSKNSRQKIVRRKNGFYVGEKCLFRDKEELLKRFSIEAPYLSPSAALRPVYQEYILPNLAYVGGPSEISYWLALGKVFRSYSLSMPILVPRLCGTLLPYVVHKKMQRLGLQGRDFFRKPKVLDKLLMRKKLDIDFSEEQSQFHQIFLQIAKKAPPPASAWQQYIAKHSQVAAQHLSQIEDKLRKICLQKFKTEQRRRYEILHFLRPYGVLQERAENFISLTKYDAHLPETLLREENAFDFNFQFVLLNKEKLVR